MVRRISLAAALAAGLLMALAAPASAGGYATVGLSSLPDGTRPGEPWVVDLTVLQHGRTPLEGVQPALNVRDANGDTTRFEAKPTGEPGVYRAEVVFPSAGRFTYTVDDGFTQTHTFAPVDISGAPTTAAAPAPAAGDDGGPSWLFALGAALAAGLATTIVLALLLRRREGGAPAAALR
jgi:hypothetical protein